VSLRVLCGQSSSFPSCGYVGLWREAPGEESFLSSFAADFLGHFDALGKELF
jgi:hypothetical protein